MPASIKMGLPKEEVKLFGFLFSNKLKTISDKPKASRYRFNKNTAFYKTIKINYIRMCDKIYFMKIIKTIIRD